MIQPIGYQEFREPSRHEMADANDAIVESYLTGEDKYDLHLMIGENLIETLWKRAQQAKVVPCDSWEVLVYKLATEMAAKWSPSEWENFRQRSRA